MAVSCSGEESVQSTSGEATHLAPIAVGSQSPQPERRWEDAYNKGVELSNQGKLAEASYYFSNALGASPGNVTVIEAYCNTMLLLGRSGRESQDAAYDPSVLQVLEGFLQGQIPFVKFDDVKSVLNILAEIRQKTRSQRPAVPEEQDKYETLLKSIADDKFELPQSGEALVALLGTLADLKEYTVERRQDDDQSDVLQKIDSLTTRAQVALEVLTLSELLKAQRESVVEACTTSATIAEYKLQECEQTLRQMVALHASTHSAQVVEELKRLRDLAQAVVEAKGDESWRASLSQLDGIRAERNKMSASTHTGGRGVVQRKLDNLQQEVSLLQNALPGLVGGSLEKAVARMNALKDEAIELSNKQSRDYNGWAMERIRTCLTKGGEGVGWFANGAEGRKTIGQALIGEMGPIDRRYLTAEVSRCFDEVMGKYLAPNQLNPVKSGSDVNEEGTILYTLNRMHETKKKQLSEF